MGIGAAFGFVVGFLLSMALIPSQGAVGAIHALIGAELFRLAITSSSLIKQWRLSALRA